MGKDEAKDNIVSLKQIKEAIQNKLNKQQKVTITKNILINTEIAFIMVIYFILISILSKNIEITVLQKSIKIITLSTVAIGIYIIELAYKKDKSKLAINALEIIVFSALNLSTVYVMKLYFNNLNTLIYIETGIVVYYILKSIIVVIKDVRKYKKDNNDIKEIIKK